MRASAAFCVTMRLAGWVILAGERRPLGPRKNAMTTDASPDVGDVDEDGDEDQQADPKRPSLSDWLVDSVRESPVSEPAAALGPDPPHADRVEEALPPAMTTDDGATAETHPEDAPEAPDEDDAPRADFNGEDDDSEIDGSRTLVPQIFADEDPDEDLSAFLLTPAQRARRAALVKVAILILGAVAGLSFLGRWISRGRSSPPPAQTSVVRAVPSPTLVPQPTAQPSATDEPSVDLDEDEAIPTAEPSRSISGGFESTGRVARTPPPDSNSAGPVRTPSWSVARYPDLSREVLIAVEQAALQAHSAAPPPQAPPPSE